jgi:hypothetical protein
MNTWCLANVEQLHGGLHRSKIVMYRSTSDKSALVWEHQASHIWSKMGRQHLSEELAEAVDQAYRTEILDLLGIRALAQEHYICMVQEKEASCIQQPKSRKNLHDIPFDHRPRRLVEPVGEPIRHRRFVQCHLLDHAPNLLLREAMVKCVVDPWHTQRGKVNVVHPSDLGNKKLVEELENGLGFVFFIAKPHTMMGELENLILVTVMANLQVEKFCIGVALSKKHQSGMLTGDYSGHRSETKALHL